MSWPPFVTHGSDGRGDLDLWLPGSLFRDGSFHMNCGCPRHGRAGCRARCRSGFQPRRRPRGRCYSMRPGGRRRGWKPLLRRFGGMNVAPMSRTLPGARDETARFSAAQPARHARSPPGRARLGAPAGHFWRCLRGGSRRRSRRQWFACRRQSGAGPGSSRTNPLRRQRHPKGNRRPRSVQRTQTSAQVRQGSSQ